MNEQRKFEYLHVVGQQSIVVIVIVAVRKPKICHRKFVVHTYTRALAKENLPQKTCPFENLSLFVFNQLEPLDPFGPLESRI
jgi:hypothetical protein